MKKSTEIRQDFLDFFASKEHRIVPSASVVPYDDPTLLFTNAGMNQFKDVFLGTGKRDYKRCADTQKCIRVSGKHNDLEEVGHDGYHHTFFEMLGNWSFGDYYKKEAIAWAWELLTKVWGLDKSRLWVTVFREDDESLELWKSETDIEHSHILKFDEKDNFWEMGDTGPCGPCSEIHYDFTPNGCKAGDVNAGNPDVMEIWNLVFIQYNRDKEGVLHDLPAKHVDTGMGFERMVRVLQNKSSNYLTDVFLPLINELINITGKEYSGKYEASMNVIADHVRTLTFAIGDGAIPSNEGRGYVLRRVLRRAARYGRNLDMRTPFIYKLVDTVVDTMGHVFPEIVEKREMIKSLIKGEEESFNVTLDRGLKLFDDEIGSMKKSGSKIFSGEVAFKLHDTYGFPIDLTQLMAREIDFNVDEKTFDELMNEQKRMAKEARKEIDMTFEFEDKHKHTINIDFSYDPYNVSKYGIDTRIIATEIHESLDKTIVYLYLNPFYHESGGQVSDVGKLILEDGREYDVEGSLVNRVIVKGIEKNFDDLSVKAVVDYPRRQSIQRNHSTTHLMHEALRRVLGSHVKQMGSYLDDKLLRFDFPHFHKLTPQEITDIEDIVNNNVKENIPVSAEEMPMESAKKIPNVKMFFGEKYGDVVRVVTIDPNFSVELCGGTHVKDTSDIGLFKIIKEESISSGTRRIIARTGQGIIDYINERVVEIEKISSELPEKYYNNFKLAMDNFKKDFEGADFRDAELLKTLIKYHDSTVNSLMDVKEKYLEEKKHTEKELAKQKVQSAAGSIDELLSTAKDLNGINIVTGKFDMDNADELKEIADKLREKLKSGVGLLYSIIEGKVSLVAVVSDDLIKGKKLSAGKIAGDFAKILGGGGGGKPHLAAAGGKDVTKIDEAIAALPGIIQKNIE
ncbi:MAG: alanine--tRNA ligase [Ignavibacteria bacterium]|nr:alanine--tRNA ligase [Ignavibacteria bacterium]